MCVLTYGVVGYSLPQSLKKKFLFFVFGVFCFWCFLNPAHFLQTNEHTCDVSPVTTEAVTLRPSPMS